MKEYRPKPALKKKTAVMLIARRPSPQRLIVTNHSRLRTHLVLAAPGERQTERLVT